MDTQKSGLPRDLWFYCKSKEKLFRTKASIRPSRYSCKYRNIQSGFNRGKNKQIVYVYQVHNNHDHGPDGTIQVIRDLVSCQDLVPLARFHTRPLQSLLRPWLKNIEKYQHLQIQIPAKLQGLMKWWLCQNWLVRGISKAVSIRIVITSHASQMGWECIHKAH